MQKIYISGALTNVQNPQEIKRFYEEIGDLCTHLGLTPYVPHLKTDPVKNPHISPQEVFKLDKAIVSSSDLVIAYIGAPSLGVGMELAYADTLNIPIILLYESGAQISRFPRGIPHVIAEVKFGSYPQALEQLEAELWNVLENNLTL